ncbi:hypothetical protein LJC12_04385 [Odoribacter sp. OttesenSCG-928-J03]|nr:hypothetical protein [Odoribacter sp. OttesenSCG-928-J03]MDL2283144.1 hypothetical protein [Odoribacter sp. OttesenSCG-928-G04]MDL2330500.1 hypothetical protein [Odoribacter sp. OttesenSCG-928-A06]
MKHLKWICLIALSSIVFYSCGDEDLLDFDKVDGVENWTPDFTAPVAFGNYTAWDLVSQAGDTVVYTDGSQIFIRHTEENIYSMDAEKVVRIPENIATANVPVNVNMPGGMIGIPLVQDFAVNKSDTVNISFREGSLTQLKGNMRLDYSLPSMPFSYNAEIIVKNLLDESASPVKITDEVRTTDKAGSRTLNGMLIDMEETPNQLVLEINLAVLQGQTINTADLEPINIQLILDDFEYTEIQGVINSKTMSIESYDLNLDVTFWDDFRGSFAFTDPKIQLVVNNYGLALPMHVDMDFTAYGDGKQLGFTSVAPLAFQGWIFGGAEVEEFGEYNKNNSNVADLLSLPPKDKIEYGGSVIINPTSESVTIVHDAHVNIGLEIEIPLNLTAKDIHFLDTIKDVSIDDAELIKKANIKVIAENGLPLELGSGYLYFLDAENQLIDSVVVEKFVDAPEVNAAGDVIAPKKGENTITLSEQNVDNLQYMKSMLISVKASTSNDGTVPTAIKPDAKLQLQLLLNAQLDMKELDF